jgi:hypothetical protein
VDIIGLSTTIPTVAEVLWGSGYAIVASAETFCTGKDLLQGEPPADVSVLVHFRLDGGHCGTELIASMRKLKNAFLCTNDFEDEAALKAARQVCVRVMPKPLCYFAEPIQP